MGLMREGREEHSRGREKPGEFSGSQNGCRRRERGPDEAGEVTSGLCWTREAGAMINPGQQRGQRSPGPEPCAWASRVWARVCHCFLPSPTLTLWLPSEEKGLGEGQGRQE